MQSNNTLLTFIKVSLLFTILFGGLLAQSYATTLFSNTIMKMNIEVSATDAEAHTTKQTASMTMHNDELASLAFGDLQLDIKTTFFSWDEKAKEHEQIFAEILVQKLNESGELQVIKKPSVLVLRNEWAELKFNSEDGQEGIQLKMQFEDFQPEQDDNAYWQEPEWLNWSEKAEENTEVC